MVKYLLKNDNGEFDINSSFNVERPDTKILQSLTPNTDIYMVDINNNNTIIFSKQVSVARVIKDVLNVYPNRLFDLNNEFFVNEEYKNELYETALFVVETRHKDSPTSLSPEEFADKYNQHITSISKKEHQEIEL